MKDLVLRASASARWLTCPASLKPVVKELTPTEYASEGTRLHGIAYDYLTNGIEIKDIKEDDWALISAYCKYVKGITPADAFLETRLTTTFHGATITGQPDALVLKGTSLHVVDMKFAHGRRVTADRNTQLLVGAWLFMRNGDRDVRDLTLAICQGTRVDTVFYDEEQTKALMFFLERCIEIAIQSAGEDIYNPSETACRYCPHILTCKKMIETEKEFRNGQPYPHDLDRLYADAQVLKARIAAVEREAYAHLVKGGSLDNWKLVQGKGGHRKWIDEEQIHAFLLKNGAKEQDIYKKVLISPAQADKLFSVFGGIQELSRFCSQSPPRPTMTSINDPRPAWNGEDLNLTNYESEDEQ